MAKGHGKKLAQSDDARSWRDGQAAFRAGRYGPAIKAWKGLVRLPAAKQALAEAYYRRGVLTQTIDDLEAAHAYAPDDSRVVPAMVRLLVREGDYAKAWKMVQGPAAAQVAPKAKAALATLVGAVGADSTAQVVRALRAIVARSDVLPTDDRHWPAWVRALLHAAHRVTGDPLPSDDEVPAMPRTGPVSARALEKLYTLVAAARDDSAVPSSSAIATLAVDHLPPSTEPFMRWLVRRVVAHHALTGNAVDALKLATRFTDFLSAKELAAVRVRAGEALFADGDARLAARYWQEARSFFPLDQPIAVALERFEPETAIGAWERAVRAEERRLAPGRRSDLSGLYLHVAQLALRNGQSQTAVSYFDRGLKWAVARPDPEVYAQFAASLEDIDAPVERQIEVWRSYLEGAPTDVGAVRRLAQLLAATTQYREAFDAVADVAGEMTPERLSEVTSELYVMIAFPALYISGHRRIARELEGIATEFAIPASITGLFLAHALLDEHQLQAARKVLETAKPSRSSKMGADNDQVAQVQRLLVVEGWAWTLLGEGGRAETCFKMATGQNNHDDAHMAAIIAQMLCLTHVERGHQNLACNDDPTFKAALRWLKRATNGSTCALSEIDFDRVRCRNFRDALLNELLQERMFEMASRFDAFMPDY